MQIILDLLWSHGQYSYAVKLDLGCCNGRNGSVGDVRTGSGLSGPAIGTGGEGAADASVSQDAHSDSGHHYCLWSS